MLIYKHNAACIVLAHRHLLQEHIIPLLKKIKINKNLEFTTKK